MAAPEIKHGVVALLTDAEGRYLFIRRALTLKRAPGYWCFPGGEVEPGESFEVAIAREVQEEVGFQVNVIGKELECPSPKGEYLLHWMRCTLKDNKTRPNISFNSAEVAEAFWLYPSESFSLNPMLPTLETWLKAQI